ncbi:Conserved putative Glycine oxidase (fragment) [Capnocytophaga canimorsus]|uniref:Conserved putative Glycine oxidase n=1 Tax=Capnocytophaga canimorsus TaxID=28188 RepID=A0A0B7IQR9_9FLAO
MTYQWEDLTENPTEKAKEELIQKLEKLINCSYEIINQEAAVRPTVADRRPLIGKHPKYNNLYIFKTGLGTRGVMIAPYVAKLLADSIYKGIAIDKEVDVNRYKFA